MLCWFLLRPLDETSQAMVTQLLHSSRNPQCQPNAQSCHSSLLPHKVPPHGQLLILVLITGWWEQTSALPENDTSNKAISFHCGIRAPSASPWDWESSRKGLPGAEHIRALSNGSGCHKTSVTVWLCLHPSCVVSLCWTHWIFLSKTVWYWGASFPASPSIFIPEHYLASL